MAKKNKNYMSNMEFYYEIIKCQEEGEISDKLGKMFMMLVQRYATKPNFSGYSYNEDMISNGIMACVNAFHKFDPEKSKNPFSYFTTVTHTAFIQVLNKEKKQHNIRDEKLLENNMNPSFNYLDKHYEELQNKRLAEERADPEEQED